jgi:prepilin-type N-terminal cleavage/methylation domain-containing protein
MHHTEPPPPGGWRAEGNRPRRGFTMVEVLVAVLILGIVSAAIGAFLSAVGTRGTAQLRLSDPAIEAVVAMRRLGTVAPNMRCVLLTEETRALLWLSDENPNLAVNLSEVGLIRFDAANAELVLESLDRAALLANPALELEFDDGTYADIFEEFDRLRSAGSLRQRLLAEGLQSVEFETPASAQGTARSRFRANDYETLAVIAPIPLEVPLR